MVRSTPPYLPGCFGVLDAHSHGGVSKDLFEDVLVAGGGVHEDDARLVLDDGAQVAPRRLQHQVRIELVL